MYKLLLHYLPKNINTLLITTPFFSVIAPLTLKSIEKAVIIRILFYYFNLKTHKIHYIAAYILKKVIQIYYYKLNNLIVHIF